MTSSIYFVTNKSFHLTKKKQTTKFWIENETQYKRKVGHTVVIFRLFLSCLFSFIQRKSDSVKKFGLPSEWTIQRISMLNCGCVWRRNCECNFQWASSKHLHWFEVSNALDHSCISYIRLLISINILRGILHNRSSSSSPSYYVEYSNTNWVKSA